MDVEDPLDFELEDPLLRTPSPANTKRRRKLIGLDDLLDDHYKEESKFAARDSKQSKATKCYNSDEDEDKTRKNKERELSKLVDNCHKQVHEMATEVDIPLWGLQVFGRQKEAPSLDLTNIQNCKLILLFSEDKANLFSEMNIEKEVAFLEGLLKNGWLLKLVNACGYLEDSIGSWIFKQMLYSSKEELHSSACEFWCSLLSNEVGVASIKLDWLPNYSEIKSALEIYGYLFGCYNYASSSQLPHTDSGCEGPPLNIKCWIKFVAALCRLRSSWPILSTSEAEELLSIIISLFLDRQLQGFLFLLDECVRSVISFFTDDEWHATCEKVTDSIAHSIPKDLNCLRIVECISLVNARSKKLRSELAFRVLIHCFDKHVTSATEILKFLVSVNVKEKNCDFVRLYIYLVLVENWLCSNLPTGEKSFILKMWCKYLRNCSTQITSTDWRSYASKVRNRASYLLQTATSVKECQ